MVNKRCLTFAIGLAKGLTLIEAARQAGYKGNDNVLKTTGSRLSRHPSVIARMKEVEQATLEAAKAGREEAIRTATAIMRGSLVPFVSGGGLSIANVTPEQLAGVESIRVTSSDKGSSIAITLDRLGAVDRLAKMLGWNVPEEVNVNATRDEDAKALQIAMMKRVSADPKLNAAFQVVAMEQAKMLAEIRKGNAGGGKA
jgi:hypothetical protein